MAVLKKREVDFLRKHQLSRFATASRDGRPHVVPVVYAMDEEDLIIAIDYGTKKLKNLRANKHVALVVDDYSPNAGIMVEGEAEILERGKEYKRLLQILFDAIEYYRKNPWKEGESPIIRVRPTKAAFW